MRRGILHGAVGALTAVLFLTSGAHAGPYAPAAGATGSTAVVMSSPLISSWASGYQNYSVGPNVDLMWQTPAQALGPAEGDNFSIVALGDGGSITLTFDQPIGDGPGFDFAIFENGFSDAFLELAFVEVSSDGAAFYRFDSDSLTLNPVPFINGSIDPTNIDGLAGKYRQGYGTPFDLADVGLGLATHVRIIDIIGDGAARDTSGDVIFDPYPTVGSGGFDLDAVAVMHEFNGRAGDADLDGDVDLSDLGALASNYGQTRNATWSMGDFDFDFDVDLADLGALASNYGAGPQQALADFQTLAATVPEAATAAPMILLAAWGALRRPRDASRSTTQHDNGVVAARSRIAARCLVMIVTMIALSVSTHAAFAQVVDFDDVSVPAGGFYNGSDGAGAFTSGAVTFDNVYDDLFQSWYGFAASNVSDSTTPGYGNQYAAITGSGVGGAGNYAVGFDPLGGGYGSPPRIELNHTASVAGLFVTNITYTYFAVADGDDGNPTPFVRQFGDDPALPGGGNQGYADHLLLRITGHDVGVPVGSVDFDLADYRFADNADDYVVDSWQWIDLTWLGAVDSLTFAVSSTDTSWGYINTPAYFAIDNLIIAPEPATPLASILVACGLISRRRCAKR